MCNATVQMATKSYQKDVVISSVAIEETTNNEDTTDKHHKVHYSCSFLCMGKKPEYTWKLVNYLPHIHAQSHPRQPIFL